MSPVTKTDILILVIYALGDNKCMLGNKLKNSVFFN